MALVMGHIVIDGSSGVGVVPHWNPRTYEQAVQRVLVNIFRTQTGDNVRATIRRRINIIPQIDNSCRRSAAEPSPGTRHNYNRVVRENEWVAYDRRTGQPIRDRLGMGVGHEMQIWFNPNQFNASSPHFCLTGNQSRDQSIPEQHLIHELVHCLQGHRGVLSARPLPGRASTYGNYSEFEATLVETIFLSETRRSIRDRLSLGIVPNPDRYYETPEYQLLIMNFCRDFPAFTRSLARVHSNFNPLREYYRDLYGLEPSTRERVMPNR